MLQLIYASAASWMLMFGSLLVSTSTRASNTAEDESNFKESVMTDSVNAESVEGAVEAEGTNSSSSCCCVCGHSRPAPGELLRDLGEVDRDLDLDSDAEIIWIHYIFNKEHYSKLHHFAIVLYNIFLFMPFSSKFSEHKSRSR